MSPIQSDGASLTTNEYPDGLENDNDIINAFMTDPEEGDGAQEDELPKKKVAKKPEDDASSEDDETPADDEDDSDEASEETPEEDAEADEDGEPEDKTKEKKFADDSDETYVKIKEGDTEHEVPVKDLKRLWGQEAALTRNSQEVAAQRKTVDADRAKNIAAYDVMLKRVTERADSYRALPWTQLMKDPNVPADQLQALQAEANNALQDEQFIKTELDGFMAKVSEEQKAVRVKTARDCIKTLTDDKSPLHIKGWNEATYNELRSFGNEMGLDTEMVNGLTDPGAFKILHMAMQFKRGSSKVKTVKVNKTPTKIVKNSASAPAARSSSKTVTAKSAVRKAAASGTMDDAVNAFLALDGED